MTTNQDKTIYVTENKQEFVPDYEQDWDEVVSEEIPVMAYILAETKDQVRPMDRWVIGHVIEKATSPNGGLCFLFREKETERTHVINAYTHIHPLKTEADIRREAEIQKIDRAYSYACGYALISANNMSESLYNQGVRVVDEKFIEEVAKDKGYIKPRELTDDHVDKFTQEFDGDIDLSSFDMGARWAEKHIKGEA